METSALIIVVAAIGALGGFVHWITPGDEKAGLKDLVRRMVMGAIAAALLEAPIMLEVLNTSQGTELALLLAAPAILLTGYGGVEIVNFAKGKYSEGGG